MCACRIYGATSSFIDVPRINFAGKYHADVATANNEYPSYAYSAGYTDHEFIPGWNVRGGGGFSFINCTVKSVTYKNGSTSQSDAIVGSRVVLNQGTPQAKLVDLDPIGENYHTFIFGMVFTLMNDTSTDPVIMGSSAPFVIVQDDWQNVPCLPMRAPVTHSATVLQNVTMSSDGSEILQQMQLGWRGPELSVGLSLYSHCPTSATGELTECGNTGYLVGSIGVIQSDSDPAAFSSFASNRIMTFDDVEQPEIDWPHDDPCSKAQNTTGEIWMYKAPFNIDATSKAVRVVFGNAFTRNPDGLSVKDFGSTLSLAVLNENDSCVDVLANGDIPYRQPGWLESSAGMFDAALTDNELQALYNNSLVVVRLVQPGENKSVTEYPPCTNSGGMNPLYQLMLRESPYYIRPHGNYAYRLEAGDTANISVYVTHFGQPSANRAVIVQLSTPKVGTPYSDGIELLQPEGMTDEQGVVHFTFAAKSYKTLAHCGYERMLYHFIYKVKDNNSSCVVEHTLPRYQRCVNPLGFILWRDDSEKFKPPYSWKEHVGPIFKQYDTLFPVMRSILNLSDFTDVTQPRNIRLLRYAMSLDFNHASYMPVTRDLSPMKQNAILKWLDDPLYESPILIMSSDVIALCNAPIFIHPANEDMTTCPSATFALHPHFAECAHFDYHSANLAEWQQDALKGTCTLSGLQRQLQQAIELEFATIPLYLTALFSIKDGYNREVYNIIRTVVLQEMLHLAQAANLLIAVGGRPQIDNKMAALHYPSTGLPGNILPNLNVTLKRASREHIYEVFMTLEHPHHFTMANSTTHSSIGDFYDQMLQCMEKLESERWHSLFRRSRAKDQMHWPWDENDYGRLYIVNNIDDARAAISMIREQGEGSTPADPTPSGSDELGHFFLFEQIVCGRRLIYDPPSKRYSFTGAPVEFDPDGVWPVRDHPSQEGLTPNTLAYTAAWVFHKEYRSLLKQLQAVFDGNPEGIRDTVVTMETLIIFGKRAAAEKIDPDACDSETVGPVWDYEWNE